MGPPPSTSTDVPPASTRGLSHPKRFITDHDSDGNAIFSTALPEEIPFQQIPNDAIFSLCYATNNSPVLLNDNADVNVYSSMQPISRELLFSAMRQKVRQVCVANLAQR